MTTTEASETDVLRCPECSTNHDGTLARIGNRKTNCRTCNRFAQTVRRFVARDLMRAHPEETAQLRRAVEDEAYRQVVGTTDQREERTP